MTFGASGPGVRTHRRGGKGTRRFARRKLIAPWIIITAVSVLGVSLLTAGFVYLITGGCSGTPDTVRILTSSSIEGSLKTLARSWQDTEPAVNGRCVAVEVQAKDSAEVQRALSPNWDEKTNGDRPDVWVPESTAWARMAADRDTTAKMLPDVQPSIARSSAVIAMPKTMAQAIGWPNKQLSWPDLVKKAGDGKGWAAYDHADWGQIKIGMSNPLRSTAGLLALLAIIDSDGDGNVTEPELASAITLKKTMFKYEDDPDALLRGLSESDQKGQALGYLSAFPALERDVLQYNNLNPKEPLSAVYPSDGTADADNPYLILQNAPWVTSAHQEAAQLFLDYVRGENGRQQLQSDGFRDPNGVGGANFSEANGLTPQIAAPARDVMQADAVTNTLSTWTALNRTTNLLFVMDTSAPMGAPTIADGKDTTLLKVAQEALTRAMNMIGDQSQVGLWQFSSGYGTGLPYEELVPIGKFDQNAKDAITGSISTMTAGGESALYDTTLRAYEHLTKNYLKGATNMVVILTAGANNNPAGGLSLAQLTEQLAAKSDPNQPVSVNPIAYGDQADVNAMQQIATATKGQYSESTGPGEISKALLNALFSVQ